MRCPQREKFEGLCIAGEKTLAFCKYGFPCEQLIANKGRKNGGRAFGGVSAPISFRLAAVPGLQPLLDPGKAAVLLVSVRKDALSCFDNLLALPLVLANLAIAFVRCVRAPEAFWIVLYPTSKIQSPDHSQELSRHNKLANGLRWSSSKRAYLLNTPDMMEKPLGAVYLPSAIPCFSPTQPS